MIIAHYTHRLPADHDLGALRRWLKERGAVLGRGSRALFKAFLLREAGRFGATANNFSSVYLWQEDKAFRGWLVRGGYKIVTDIFGRAEIFSAVVGLDPRNWKFARVLLSEAEPDASVRGVAYQIAHLSRSLLDPLPQEAPR